MLLIAAVSFGYLFFQNQNIYWAKWSFWVAGIFGFLLFRAMWIGRKIKKTLM